MDDEGGAEAGPKLPALPADGMDIGVLPRVIKTLVERRAVVKKMLKKEKVCVSRGGRMQAGRYCGCDFPRRHFLFSLRLVSERERWAPKPAGDRSMVAPEGDDKEGLEG